MISSFEKTKTVYLVTALALLMSACGRGNNNNNNNRNPPPPPPPTTNIYNPSTNIQGCVGGVNNTYVSLSGYYDVVREMMMPSYQCAYGNMTVSNVKIGTTTITGTFSWQQMYDKLGEAIASCQIATTSGNRLNVSVWAYTDFFQFNGILNNSSNYLGACRTENLRSIVSFQRPNVTTSFADVMIAIAQANSSYYAAYPSYYYGGYSPYVIGGGSNVFGGLSYNSGSGLSINVGGIFGW